MQAVEQLESKRREQTTTKVVGSLGIVAGAAGIVAAGTATVLTGGLASPFLIGKDFLFGATELVGQGARGANDLYSDKYDSAHVWPYLRVPQDHKHPGTDKLFTPIPFMQGARSIGPLGRLSAADASLSRTSYSLCELDISFCIKMSNLIRRAPSAFAPSCM